MTQTSITVICSRCGNQQTFENRLVDSTQMCSSCGREMEVRIVVAPEKPFTKRRGLIGWLESLGAVVDATTPSQVEEIRFANGAVVNEHVIASLKLLPLLQCVTVLRSEFTDDLLGLLGDVAPHLCDLNLAGGQVTDAGLDRLFKHPLMRLGIPNNNSEGKALRHFPKLREIDLSGNPVIDESLLVLLDLQRPADYKAKGRYPLKRLDLRNTPVGDRSVDTLVKLSANSTRVDGALISDDGLLRLGKGNSSWDVRKISGPKITRLGQSRAFAESSQYLNLWKRNIELGVEIRWSNAGDGLSLYASGERVSNLDIINAGWRGYSDRFSELRLCSPRITDDIIRALTEKGLQTVSTVSLFGTYTRKSLDVLPNLGEISYLELCSDRIANSDLQLLSRLNSLHYLAITSSQIDDNAIEYLCDVPTLKTVDLRRTRISEKGRDRILARFKTD